MCSARGLWGRLYPLVRVRYGVQDPADFTYTKGTLTIDTTTIGGILRASPSHLVVWPIYSSGLTMVIPQKPPEPFVATNRRVFIAAFF